MVTFERMLFDFNEYMHHSGILAEHAYIDENLFILIGLQTFLIMMAYIYYVHPLVTQKIMNIKVSGTTGIYIMIGVTISFLSFLYLEHAYGLLFGIIVVDVAIYIIYTDKRFVRVREFIGRFF